MKSGFWSFKKARKYARKLSLKNHMEWNKWIRGQKRNIFIPCDPYDYYKNKGWISWMDWLGSGYLPFKQARETVRLCKLESYGDWEKWLKSGRRPHNIPTQPQRVMAVLELDKK